MKTKKIFSILLTAAMVFTTAANYAPKVEAKTTAWETNLDVSWIDTDKPMVALTFDDGPIGCEPEATSQQILDTIEKNGAHCTFFYIGQNINENNADEIRRAQSLGCEIGNHSWAHMDFTGQTKEQIEEAVNSTSEVLTEITGIDKFLVRPPYFGANALAGSTITSPLICASVDTTDWSGKSAEDIVDYALNNVQDGSIVLMHETMPNTAVAVKTLIPALIEKGYQLVTVSEMMQAKGVTMTSGKMYLSTEWYWTLAQDEEESPSPSSEVSESPSTEPSETPAVSVSPSTEPSETPVVSEVPSIAPTVTPSENDLTGTFKVQSDWNSGYQVEFTVTNNSDKAISSWQVQFSLQDNIDNLWCANQVSKEGNVYTIANADWNGTIAAHSSVSFGFTAIKNAGNIVIPDDIVVLG